MVLGAKSQREAFDRRLISSEAGVPWANPGAAAPRKAGKALCPRCSSCASPRGNLPCQCAPSGVPEVQSPRQHGISAGTTVAVGHCTADAAPLRIATASAGGRRRGSFLGRSLQLVHDTACGDSLDEAGAGTGSGGGGRPACARIDFPDLSSVNSAWLTAVGPTTGGGLLAPPGTPCSPVKCFRAPASSVPEADASGVPGPRDLRRVWEECKESSAGSSEKLVSFSEPARAMPGRSASEALPDLRKVWLGCRHGSIAGSHNETKTVSFQEPVQPHVDVEEEEEGGEVDFQDLGEGPSAQGMEAEIEDVDEEFDTEDALDYQGVEPGVPPVRHRSLNLLELRSMWLGSRNGSVSGRGTETLAEMSIAPVARSATLGRDRRVSFQEASGTEGGLRSWGGSDDGEEAAHCEGRGAQAASRVEELRSIWLGSRQGSLAKSEEEDLGLDPEELLEDGSTYLDDESWKGGIEGPRGVEVFCAGLGN